MRGVWLGQRHSAEKQCWTSWDGWNCEKGVKMDSAQAAWGLLGVCVSSRRLSRTVRRMRSISGLGLLLSICFRGGTLILQAMLKIR